MFNQSLISQILPVLLILCIFTVLCCAEESADSTHGIYGPYKQVYPDVNILLPEEQRNCSVNENMTCPLYIALMMAFDGDYITSGVIPAVQLALDEINNDSSILPGYTLHYTLIPSRVSSTT